MAEGPSIKIVGTIIVLVQIQSSRAKLSCYFMGMTPEYGIILDDSWLLQNQAKIDYRE